MRENIEVRFQAFISDGGEEFGAVRASLRADGPSL
jgi:hypothetical protein